MKDAGLQGPASRRALRALPRALAHARPDWVYEAVRIVTTLYALDLLPRARHRAPRRCPPSGPVILAPNHFSFMDHFFLGVSIRRKVRFMAKSQLFTSGRCSGSTRTAACSRCAAATPTRRRSSPPRGILERGGAIAMYCEGGRSRTGKLSEKPQAAASGGWRWRPARRSCRSRSTAPRRCATGSGCSSRRSTVQYGDPIRWERVEDPTREQQQAVADEIFAEMRKLYEQLDAVGRSGVSAAARAAPGVTEVLRPGVLAGVRMAVAGAGDAVAARARALGADVAPDGEIDVLVWDGAELSGRAVARRRMGCDPAGGGGRTGRRRADRADRAAARRRARGGGAGRAGEHGANALDRVGAARDPAGGGAARARRPRPARWPSSWPSSPRRPVRTTRAAGSSSARRRPARPPALAPRLRARGLPGTSSAASAPTASTAAPTQTALVMPSVYACGDAYEPLRENTVASTATPSTPPSSRIAFVAPDAWPASSGRTAPSTALAAGANTSAMPVPAITNGIDELARTARPARRSTPASRSPAACSARPVAISGREPIRSDSMPGDRRDEHRHRRSTAASAARPPAASSPA